MSVIIFPATYPDRVDQLEAAGSLLLSGIRAWVAHRRLDVDPLPLLCEIMDAAGACEAAFSLDRFMDAVEMTASRPIAIQCSRCPGISAAEMGLLHLASLAQAGRGTDVHDALCSWLISAQAAELAPTPLEGLGKLFATAGLRFPRRRLPASAPALVP